MKFLITSKSPSSENVYRHIYENISGAIQSTDGSDLQWKLNLTSEMLNAKVNPDEDKSYFHKKGKNLHKLKIQLGFKCNFKCKYCNQRSYERMIPIEDQRTSSIDEFVNKLIRNVDSVDEILFMGGEPFVYIKTLDPLCKAIRTAFPNVRFTTITNGSLLDIEMADWCLKNRMNLTISHDGPYSSKYREGVDVLADSKSLAGIRHFIDRNKSENIGLDIRFNVVVTSDNWKLSELPKYFQEALQRTIPIQFESIAKLTTSTVDQVKPFDEESVNGLIMEILMGAMNGEKDNPLIALHRVANNLAKRIVSQTNLSTLSFYCDNAKKNTMAVDLKGNLLACHAFPSFKTGYSTIDQASEAECDIPIPWSKRADCQRCPVLASCLGGCPLQDQENHEITCRNLRIWHTGFFLAAWYQLFGTIIQSIDPIEDRK